MAIFHKYTCPKCGFEIETADSFGYCLMSGTYVTVKCSQCGIIDRMKISPKHYTEPYSASLFEVIQLTMFNSDCPNCHNHGDFAIWEPQKGCPNCGSELSTSIGELLVD